MRQIFTPIVVNAPQRSPEWYSARLGNVTASNLSKTMGYYQPTKKDIEKAIEYYQEHRDKYDNEWLEKMMTEHVQQFCLEAKIWLKELADRTNYRKNTVTERITGLPAELDPYVTKDMQWGIMNEVRARELYRERYGAVVKDAPFMMHPELLCGASPDGLVVDTMTGELGTIEIKCLRSTNHLYKVMAEDEIPEDYFDQIQMQMWITGRDWCDFVAYDSRVKENLQLFVKRMKYDEFYIDNVMLPMLTRFLDECDADERQFYAIAHRRQLEAEAMLEQYQRLISVGAEYEV